MSRTLPIDSPLGPKTGNPASWATKTLVFGGTMIRLGRWATRVAEVGRTRLTTGTHSVNSLGA
jgi:hypothetical protein